MRVLVTAGAWALRLLLPAVLLAVPPDVSAASGTPGIGAHAPTLELTGLDGVARRVGWGEGAPAATVVFFFDPQSPECLLELGFLEALHQRARDFGLAVYAVEGYGKQPAEVKLSLERFFAVYGDPGFPVLPDPAFRAGRTFGAEQSTVTFVMESHGLILNRIEGYDHTAAVAVVRRLEQLLLRPRGFFEEALRGAGVTETEERAADAQILAALTRPSAPARHLEVGNRAPEVEFVDRAGRTGRWSWSEDAAKGPRILAFFDGFSLVSVEELSWLNTLARRGREAGLEVLAVEAAGMDAVALEAGIEKFQRYKSEMEVTVARDAEGKLARAFGPWERLPQTYLMAADGTILAHASGFSTEDSTQLADKTERAYFLLGRPFPPPGSRGTAGVPSPIDEEAPSVRKQQELDTSFQSNIVQANAAFLSWEFDRSLEYYIAALDARPSDLHALARVAEIYERRGNIAAALLFWDKVLLLQPDHVQAADRVRELRDLPETGSD